MERENTEESTTKESAEKENELHTQIGLSLLSGLVASMAPIALDVRTPHWAVAFIMISGFMIWGVLKVRNCPAPLDKKSKTFIIAASFFDSGGANYFDRLSCLLYENSLKKGKNEKDCFRFGGISWLNVRRGVRMDARAD